MTGWRFAVMGPIGVGKDTVCAAVVARAAPGSSVRHIKIGSHVVRDLDSALIGERAAPGADEWLAELRGRMVAAGVPSIADQLDADLRRRSLQWWGAYRRNAQPNYWLDRLSEALDDAASADVVYVSDVRTDAEVDLLRNRGFLIVQLAATPETLERRTRLRDGAAPTVEAIIGDGWEPASAEHPKADMVVQNISSPATSARSIIVALQTWWGSKGQRAWPPGRLNDTESAPTTDPDTPASTKLR